MTHALKPGHLLVAASLLAACGDRAQKTITPADSTAIVAKAVAAVGSAWPSPLPHTVAAFVRDSSGYVVDLVPRARVAMGRYRVHFTKSQRVIRWELLPQ